MTRMILPRPPGWSTNRRILRVRAWWHRHDLPCPFCRAEIGRWRR